MTPPAAANKSGGLNTVRKCIKYSTGTIHADSDSLCMLSHLTIQYTDEGITFIINAQSVIISMRIFPRFSILKSFSDQIDEAIHGECVIKH